MFKKEVVFDKRKDGRMKVFLHEHEFCEGSKLHQKIEMKDDLSFNELLAMVKKNTSSTRKWYVLLRKNMKT
jgi:predicted aminopeptidase